VPTKYSRIRNYSTGINGIIPQSKLWTLFSAASCGEFYHTFSSAESDGTRRRINVFPVRDADTGTNLASTLRAVIDNARPTD
jgi:hypothetical protein